MKKGRISGFLICLALAALLIAGPAEAGKDHLIIGLEDVVSTMNYYQTTARVALICAYMQIKRPLHHDRAVSARRESRRRATNEPPPARLR